MARNSSSQSPGDERDPQAPDRLRRPRGRPPRARCCAPPASSRPSPEELGEHQRPSPFTRIAPPPPRRARRCAPPAGRSRAAPHANARRAGALPAGEFEERLALCPRSLQALGGVGFAAQLTRSPAVSEQRERRLEEREARRLPPRRIPLRTRRRHGHPVALEPVDVSLIASRIRPGRRYPYVSSGNKIRASEEYRSYSFNRLTGTSKICVTSGERGLMIPLPSPSRNELNPCLGRHR